jgi:hypothetical protein
VRTDHHTNRFIAQKEEFENTKHIFDDGVKRFFKLFEESTFEGSGAAARKMKKIAKGQCKAHQTFMLFHGLYSLIHSSTSEVLSWPNSPLLVMLQFVDPNVLIGNDESSFTPLHHVADLLDPTDYSIHVKQLILAKQLVEHGANVNAVSIPHSKAPLHNACFAGNVTNLDFVEFLLNEGADPPNTQDCLGRTPLLYTIPHAPGAAKFLLNWPTTDANITDRSGASFLASIRPLITYFSAQIALPDNTERV